MAKPKQTLICNKIFEWYFINLHKKAWQLLPCLKKFERNYWLINNDQL